MKTSFDANYLNLNILKTRIVFDAIPATFVSLSNSKRKNKNYFYIIMGMHLEEADEYLVSAYLYKKKKQNGNFSFILEQNEVQTFNNKIKVVDFLYNYLDKFSPHQRHINYNLAENAEGSFDEVLLKITKWMEIVQEYFIIEAQK
jgi:hypothetical protein